MSRLEPIKKINRNVFSVFVAPRPAFLEAYDNLAARTVNATYLYLSQVGYAPLLQVSTRNRSQVNFIYVEDYPSLVRAIRSDRHRS